MMMKYDVRAKTATEFINHDEIKRTMAHGRFNAENYELIELILAKAAAGNGLDHRDAAVLLECNIPELNQEMFALAKKLKEKLYGKRIVMFAPLYLSNLCVNSCTYCPYHAANTQMPRVKMTQEEIARQVMALQDMGHKRLALELGEHPQTPIDYVLQSIRTIYAVRHRNGQIRRVNVNIAATTVPEYRMLKDAGIGTYILFQETYHQENYAKLHPRGPKSNYAWHTEAMDRAMEAGIDDVGIGVLFGLSDYLYDFVGLLMHAEHLEATWGVGPHTISVPRICAADDIDVSHFGDAVKDEVFEKLVAVIRIAVPYTGMIVSTRESAAMRERILRLGVSQISGGSATSVGGYGENGGEQGETAQFDVSDHRNLDEVVAWLLDLGYIPSFCTACYRSGRTGDRFMSLVKSGQIANCCDPNALLTLQEYLQDYASADTRAKGQAMIQNRVINIPNPAIRKKTGEWLEEIARGGHDFNF